MDLSIGVIASVAIGGFVAGITAMCGLIWVLNKVS